MASYRAQVGVILQDTLLFAGTIRHNLLLVAPDADEGRLQAALRDSNALEFVEQLPDGLETLVGERGVTLSNGQRQRLALARAILRDTPIVVLDEPTAGLDEENEQAMAAALARLAHGRTTLLVTHALHLAARADRVLVVDRGRVVEDGAPAQLLRDGGQFARWYREQSSRATNVPLPVPAPVQHVG
jgi:ATP-binding cassette subfamily B protein